MSEKDSTESKPKKRIAKATPAKWAEIERDWANGKFVSIEDLASHYAMETQVVKNRMFEKGIKRSQNIEAYNQKLQEELAKKAVAEAKLLADRIKETRDTHYKMSNNLATLAYGEVIEAKKNGIPLHTVKQNLASLESAMKVIKMAREERFAVLGIEKEGQNLDDEETPELVVNELSPEQIQAMRDAGAETPDDEDDAIVSLDADLPVDEGDEDEDEGEAA